MVLDSDERVQNFEILSNCIVHWLIFRNAYYLNLLGGVGGLLNIFSYREAPPGDFNPFQCQHHDKNSGPRYQCLVPQNAQVNIG